MSFALSGLCRPALAQPELVPAPKQVDVDWPAVARDVRTISPHLIAPPQGLLSKHSAVIGNQLERYAARDREALRPLAHLNGFVAAMYPGVDTVPIPVLAPFGTGPYLAELVRVGESRPQAAESFLSSVIAKMHFIAKTTGYDAILTVNADWLSRHNIADVDLVQVHLGGAGILYESDEGGRRGGRERRGELVKDKGLQALYPDLRRHVGADDVTYNFFKYRVPYFASIPCQGKGPPLPRIVRCAQVEPVLQGVLRDLQVIGGAPIALKRRTQVGQPRPTAMSPTFRFFAPGNLMPGTSQANKGGVTQRILHGPADLVFPIKEPDTFANSQLFMHGGDCHGRKIPLADGRYKCRQNPQKILQPREGHPENYAPPWRDNYCEVRGEPDRQPKDCPAPVGGHEGQDIRPRECVDSSGRCKIDLFDVVAVTTGDAWWTPVNHLRLIARDGTDLYYMYLHMSPDALSRAGMRRGEPVPVVPGKKVGEVGNWLKTEPAATTAHLHFEIRKQREMCGSYGCTVSPYWTLIRAYERLINAQGTEVTK
jgi:hypothetical protein